MPFYVKQWIKSLAQNLEIFEKLTSLDGTTLLLEYIERKKIDRLKLKNKRDINLKLYKIVILMYHHPNST